MTEPKLTLIRMYVYIRFLPRKFDLMRQRFIVLWYGLRIAYLERLLLEREQ